MTLLLSAAAVLCFPATPPHSRCFPCFRPHVHSRQIRLTLEDVYSISPLRPFTAAAKSNASKLTRHFSELLLGLFVVIVEQVGDALDSLLHTRFSFSRTRTGNVAHTW